jgi:hypothetical protein
MIVRQNLPMAVRVNVVPMRRRKGIGDAVSDAAAAADAIRGGAGYPSVALCSWAADSSYANDPAGQVLLGFIGAFNAPFSTMFADGWRDTINYCASEGHCSSPAAVLNGRVAPGSSELGISAQQTGCSGDMQLTMGQYWAAFVQYNAGTWKPPGAICGGTTSAEYTSSSPVLYPNIYISPTWSGNAAPAGVTDATVQAQYAATQAAAANAAVAEAVTSGSQTTTGTGVQYTASPAASVTVGGNWFTDSMIGGIPNWALLAAAAVAVFAFSSGGKR